jgi:membrane protease YdiL (CAAX protease family)
MEVKVMKVKERSAIPRHLIIVAVLLLLLIGPIFGPIPNFLGERFGIETAVMIMLFTFVIGFSIILAVIFGFDEMRADSLREKLGRLGWGQPSRLAAIIVAVIAGLAWGALFLSSTLQFDPDANLAELSLFRLAAILIAVFGAILEDLITRGYVMNAMRQINIPNWVQLVISALLFALYHTIWGFNVFNVNTG